MRKSKLEIAEEYFRSRGYYPIWYCEVATLAFDAVASVMQEYSINAFLLNAIRFEITDRINNK